MAILDQDLGDLHGVQRTIGGAVPKAFARRGTRARVDAIALRSRRFVAVSSVAETATVGFSVLIIMNF
jgi:hypothetical protein